MSIPAQSPRRVLADLSSLARSAPITLAKSAAPTIFPPDAMELIQRLMAEIEELKSSQSSAPAFTMKVSEKGCLSIFARGLNFRGVHLYASQWELLLDHADDIRAFITSHPNLARKPPAGA